MKAKQFLKYKELDKGRLTMHLNGADYSVDLQNLLEEYANQRVIDELEDHTTLEPEVVEPIRKFNNGRGALLCNTCRTIMATGEEAWSGTRLYCDKCKTIKCRDLQEKRPSH